MNISFETTRLIVKRYTADDVEIFFLLNNNADVQRYIRPVKNREQSDAFLRENLRYYNVFPAYGRWAVYEKTSGNYIGSFALIHVEKTIRMQLDYALMPAYWRKGYATELTKAGLVYTFTQTSLQIVYGYTEVENIISQMVLLKAGFVKLGSEMDGEKKLVYFGFEKERFM